MMKRVRIQITLAAVLVVGAVFMAKGMFREEMPRTDPRAGTTRPSQDEVARQRLRSLGYLN